MKLSICLVTKGRKEYLLDALNSYEKFIATGEVDVIIIDNGSDVLSKEILYNGLFIELKAPEHNRVVLKGDNAGKIVKTKGKLSPEQKVVLDRLNSIGYQAVCCFGSDEAIKVINDYFADYLELKNKLKSKKII